MIGIAGRYLCKFKIADVDNFIREDQLFLFKLIEETGNVLPIFQLVFSQSGNFDLEKYFNNGNFIDVTFGKDQQNLETIRLFIYNTTKNTTSSNSRIYTTVGVAVSLLYNLQCDMKTWGGKSIDVIKEVAGTDFNVVDETDGSDDEMNWVQPNITRRKFVNELWLHSKLKDPSDTLLLGIHANGDMRLRSMLKALSKPAEHIFTSSVVKSNNTYVYSGTPEILDERGFSGFMGGQAKTTLLYNNSGNQTMFSTPEQLNTMVNGDQGISQVGRRLSSSKIHSSNMHDTYQLSYDYNVRNLLMLQNTKAKVTFKDQHLKIKLLDTVLLKIINNTNQYYASEVDSGVWFVDKICRVIANKEYKVMVTLCRNGSNAQEEFGND